MKAVDLIKTSRGALFGKPDYWHSQLKANESVDKKLPGRYYLDMSPKAVYPGKLDEDGVPLLLVDGRSHHFPVTIAQYGLGNHDTYCATGKSRHLNNFFEVADWLTRNHTILHSSCVWYSYFEKRLYSVKAPWPSALSQGQGISVLVRAYVRRGEQRYLDTALKAAKLFEIPVGRGGIRTLVNRKHVFYEEFPSEVPSLVLNGFIFSLWGLYDLYLITREKAISRLYEEGLETLIATLPRYDLLGWSRYDLYGSRTPGISSIFYHRLHVEQLKVMALLTGNRVFKKYLAVWSKGARNYPVVVLSQVMKVLQKLAVRKLYPSVDYQV